MKLAIVYFCYKNDQDLLNLSLSNISFLRKSDDIDVYIMDDGNNSMTAIPDIDNLYYEKTYFDRRGNLNGIECIYGMTDIYAKIFNLKQYDWVIKVDADTFINTWAWLQNINNKEICQVGTLLKDDIICHGCCHGISSIGLKNLQINIKNLNKDDICYNNNRFAEDYTTSRLICNDDPAKCYYLKNKYNNPIIDDSDNGVYFDYRFPIFQSFISNLPFKFMKKYTSITFKPPYGIKKSNMSYYDRMKSYTEYFKHEHRT